MEARRSTLCDGRASLPAQAMTKTMDSGIVRFADITTASLGLTIQANHLRAPTVEDLWAHPVETLLQLETARIVIPRTARQSSAAFHLDVEGRGATADRIADGARHLLLAWGLPGQLALATAAKRPGLVLQTLLVNIDL